jgi:2'-5' RNA ligase
VNYFLAFFPDEKTNYKIRKVVGELGRVFDGQEIQVRWLKPEKFHVTTLFLGNNLNILSKSLLSMKLTKFDIPRFEINFEKAALGLSRRERERICLSIGKGGDELRELVFNLRNHLKINDPRLFVPHLTLGRVSKDLTDEEFRNLNQDLRVVNKNLKVDDIAFTPKSIAFIESDLEEYRILKEF